MRMWREGLVRGARYALLTCAAYGALLPVSGPIWAQTRQTAGADEGLEEIVVTARRVEEKLQNVPTAITAITTKDLQEKQIFSLEDLGNSVPSVIIAPQMGSTAIPQMSIRGVTSGNLNPEIDSPIGIYVDGVYLARSVGAQFDLADLQRVEVLRGPQGTLFGRNAEAGAFNFITQGPSGVLDAHLEATFGNFDSKRIKATIDTPEFNGLSARLTVLHGERDGYVKNTTPGITVNLPEPFGPQRSTSTFGGDDTTALLAALHYVRDALTVDYKFDFTDDVTQAMPTQILGFDNTATGALAASIFAIQPSLGGKSDFGTTYITSRPGLTANDEIVIMGHALTVQYDIDDNLTVKSISAYRKDDEKGGMNFNEETLRAPPFLGGAPGELFCVLCSIAKRPQHQTSEELQLLGHEEKFDWIAGFFYFDEVGFQDNVTYILKSFAPVGPNIYSAGPLTAANFANGSLDQAENRSLAGYLHATAHLTDRLDLSAGVRYTSDHRFAAYWTGPYATPGLENSLSRDFSHTDYEVTATYTIMPDVNAYGRIATGYVAGGVFHLHPYNATTNTTYEAGIKSEWLDHRALLNLAVFEQDRTDIQVQGFQPGVGQFLANGGNEHTYGVELETSVRPLPGLTLHGALGYNHYPALLATGTTVTAPAVNELLPV